MFFRKSLKLPTVADALPGRSAAIQTSERHFIIGYPLKGPYPEGLSLALFGMGCFWGAERKFWQLGDGIHITAAGYSAGLTPNPTYEEVCSGQTGHNETVLVVYNPEILSYFTLLKTFFENHDPTQVMRQGNDVGTQYRSGIYIFDDEQARVVHTMRDHYQTLLSQNGFSTITTEIQPADTFYFAEAYHQQYLAKNPSGYCGLGGTGVSCPVGTGVRP